MISHLDKGEKGANLEIKFKISKQQISDIRKNKERDPEVNRQHRDE